MSQDAQVLQKKFIINAALITFVIYHGKISVHLQDIETKVN